MRSKDASSEKLRKLFKHHAGHKDANGDPASFIDIYVDSTQVFQFGYGGFTPPSSGDKIKNKDATEYLNEQDDLSTDEMPDTWMFTGDWTDDRAYEITVGVLNRLGFDASDVTHAVEQSCPDGGMMSMDDLDGESADIPHSEDVEAPEQLLAVYEHLKDIERKAGGVPNPFPLVEYYVGEEKVGYVFGPAVHSLEWHTATEREEFDTLVDIHSNLEATTSEESSIGVTHYNWAPDSALNITEDVLDRLYDLSLDDITYAEIVTSGPEDDIPWTEV